MPSTSRSASDRKPYFPELKTSMQLTFFFSSFFLLFLLQWAAPSEGYVLIKRESTVITKSQQTSDSSNGDINNTTVELKPLKSSPEIVLPELLEYTVHPDQQLEAASSSKDDGSHQDQMQSLMIRMFEPEVEEKPHGSRVMNGSMPPSVVDVDIVKPPKKAKGSEEDDEADEAKDADEEVMTSEMADELSRLGMEEEKTEIRRKPLPPRPRLSLGKSWTVKRKTVKLPPLRSFPVPAAARAAPTLRAASADVSSENAVGEGKEKPMGAGRQFWVNALKKLLIGFRRMHPDIAKGSSRNSSGNHQQQHQQLRDNRIEAHQQ